MAQDSRIQQISLSLSARTGTIVPAATANVEQRRKDLQLLRQALDLELESWPLKLNTRFPPSPLYIPLTHINELERLQVALSKALTNIVGRWYIDQEANFPSRMPLEDHEERVLKWIAGPGRTLVPDFESHKGCWRPDYLIEETVEADGHTGERIRICEINARFPYNGFFISAHGNRGYAALGTREAGLQPTCDASDLSTALINLFDITRPLHIVQDEWEGADIHILAKSFQAQTGQLARFLKPSQLRLLPDQTSKSGYALFCVVETIEETPCVVQQDGEALERVYQVSLELKQSEYRPMSFEMLCQLSLCCINDLRSIFLVHDKRMLAVILEEIEDLVTQHKILTRQEATILRNGISPTFLPTSPTWHSLLGHCKAMPTAKDHWVLKATRGGFGHDHVFGTSVSNDEWLSLMILAQKCNSRPTEVSFVLQRKIEQVEYDIIRHDFETIEQFHLVGSYQSIDGRYIGNGPWRIARQVHVAVNETDKGLVMMSVSTAKVV